MRLNLKILSIIGIVLGGLSVLGWAENQDPYTLIAGALFIYWGIIGLLYIKDQDNKVWSIEE